MLFQFNVLYCFFSFSLILERQLNLDENSEKSVHFSFHYNQQNNLVNADN